MLLYIMNIFINKTISLVFLQLLGKKYLVKMYGDILRLFIHIAELLSKRSELVYIFTPIIIKLCCVTTNLPAESLQ